jgi:hypothetical protein
MILQQRSQMIFAFIVINCLLAASLVFSAPAQQHTDKQDLQTRLFNQVLADFKELRDCMEKEEGGLRAQQEKMTVEEYDLNRDGVPEYEVQMGGPCSCGMVNCSIYIYKKVGSGFEAILNDGAGLGVEKLRTATNGYTDLRIEARETAATTSETTYKFDGKKYREAKNILTQVETGESKPAFRRVQFKRGTSETTLQGRVSIALPDTLLIGARAGQVMTVKLTAPRKEVRFLLMSPRTRDLVADNARQWTGTLPETGDYTIIVDADERASTYSLTISIK